MAQPTSHTAPPPARQQPTPGVSPGVPPMGESPAGLAGGSRPSQHGVQQTPETAPAAPVLFDDIDPVLLVRLYPQAASGEAARSAATEAGAAAHADGLKLVAAQQEPMPPPAPAPTHE